MNCLSCFLAPNRRKTTTFFTALLVLIFCITACKPEDTTENFSGDVPAKDILKSIQTGKNINAVKATFADDIDLTLVTPSYTTGIKILKHETAVSLSFKDCTFKGKFIAYRSDKANFHHQMAFLRNVTFINCVFEDTVVFRDADVYQVFNLTGCTFQKAALFQGMQLRSRSNLLAECTFNEACLMQALFCDGNLNMLHSEFWGPLQLDFAVINGDLLAGAAGFHQKLYIPSMRVGGYTSLAGARFSNDCTLAGCIFSGDLDLKSALVQKGLYLAGCRFNAQVKFQQADIKNMLAIEKCTFALEAPVYNTALLSDSAKVQIDSSFVIRKELLPLPSGN